MKTIIYHIKITALYLFVFSLGYEYSDPLGLKGFFTIPKLAGIIYGGASLLDIKENFKITQENMLLLASGLLLFFWMLLRNLFSFNGFPSKEMRLYLSLLQVVILFWLVFNDIQRNPNVRTGIFLSLILGMVSVSLFLNAGIGLETSSGETLDAIGSSRIYFFGMNPNSMGNLATIALLLIFSIVLSPIMELGKSKYFLLLGIPSLLTVLGLSGSRGAFLILFLALALFFILRKSTLRSKIIFTLIGAASIALIYNYLQDFEILQQRLAASTEEDRLGGRTQIWEKAFSIFAERPIFGWGHPGYSFEISYYLGEHRDTHNVYLYLMVTGGLIALGLFLFFQWEILKNSFKSLKLTGDPTNLMILLAMAAILFKSGGGLDAKGVWLMLAAIAPILHNNQEP